MKNRIIEVRNHVGKNGKKMTQEEFANRLNLSRNFIYQLETGNRIPSDRTILDICKEFSVNENWLRTGEGEMFNPLDRDKLLADFTISLLQHSSEEVATRFVSALSKLDVEHWKLITDMAEALANKKE